MTGIVVPETCWAYKKYNTVISNIYLVLILQLLQWCTVQQTSKFWRILMSPSSGQFFDFPDDRCSKLPRKAGITYTTIQMRRL